MSDIAPGTILVRAYPALARLAGAGSHTHDQGFGGALRELQRGLTGERVLAGEGYFGRADYLGAYLLYYWPVSLIQVLLALEETDSRSFLPPSPRVLDLGAGPGPASFAALAMGAATCLLLDSNRPALEAASRLARDICPATASGANPVSTQFFDLEGGGKLPEGPFDLVIACHSVNELWKDKPDALERRAGLLERAAAELSDGGILLVVEPSASVTAIPALQLRDRLIGAGGTGLTCVAPCPASLPCPALGAGEGRSCHSTWKWTPPREVAALAAEAGLDRDSAKATWFALAKQGNTGVGAVSGSPAGQEPDGTGRPGLQAGTGTCAGTGAGTSAGMGAPLSGRVVSEPLLNKAGRIRFIVCAGERLATISAPASSPAAAGFLGLRRGDCFGAAGLSPRPGERNFGFEPGSSLVVEFRAPEVP